MRNLNSNLEICHNQARNLHLVHLVSLRLGHLLVRSAVSLHQILMQKLQTHSATFLMKSRIKHLQHLSETYLNPNQTKYLQAHLGASETYPNPNLTKYLQAHLGAFLSQREIQHQHHLGLYPHHQNLYPKTSLETYHSLKHNQRPLMLTPKTHPRRQFKIQKSKMKKRMKLKCHS